MHYAPVEALVRAAHSRNSREVYPVEMLGTGSQCYDSGCSFSITTMGRFIVTKNNVLCLGLGAVLSFGLLNVGCSSDSSSPVDAGKKDGSSDTKGGTGGSTAAGGSGSGGSATGGSIGNGGTIGAGGSASGGSSAG